MHVKTFPEQIKLVVIDTVIVKNKKQRIHAVSPYFHNNCGNSRALIG